MGLTVSAEEIIKDRKILKREAFLNLSWNSYLMSKVFVQFIISALQALTFVLIGNGITDIRGMYFEYWLVLFTCWASSNMLGLLISDSFKTVVTIYILIPFLVIPQIILSGIIVKFEKLNPNLSSPSSIPIYGEFIIARWGYEALSVKQFKDNKYESQFYDFDHSMSKANYKRQYWYNSLKGKCDIVENNLTRTEKGEDYVDAIEILRNEISKEMAVLPGIEFQRFDGLTVENINSEVISAVKVYLETVRQYYVKLYNTSNTQKDALIEEKMATDKEGFLKLKKDYYNTALEEFVKNSNEKDRLIEYNGELIQKIDPIFIDPPNKMIKAHFYAPRKQIFGVYFDTFYVNIVVIWTMTLILYMALYFRLLKKFLDSGEMIMGKASKGSD